MRIILLVLLLLIIPLTQASPQVSARFGSVSADKLGGIGGSKAAIQASVTDCLRLVCLDATAWWITEPLDDDAGIVPGSGYSVTATARLNKWRVGIHHNKVDDWTENYLAAGIAGKHGNLLLLIPSGNARFGMVATLKAPINQDWSLTARYDYTGRQDPDIKLSIVGFGISRQF